MKELSEDTRAETIAGETDLTGLLKSFDLIQRFVLTVLSTLFFFKDDNYCCTMH